MPLSTNYSTEIRDFYSGNTPDSKELLINIRQYISIFTFASIQSNVEDLSSKEFFCIKYTGSSPIILGTLPQPGRPEKYGQIYFVDVEEAIVA